MNGFKLDSNGDVVVKDNLITMASGTEFLCQTIRQVLKTNLGEWWLNKDEGIDFNCILTKNPDYQQIEENIKSGLRQVDEELELVSVAYELKGRKLEIHFVSRKQNTEIEIDI